MPTVSKCSVPSTETTIVVPLAQPSWTMKTDEEKTDNGMPDTTPSQAVTPPKEINPENELYRAWKEASEEVRPTIEVRLLQSLRRHAAKVCWLVLHSHQHDLIEEVAQDAFFQLPSFEERSSFSTWVHSRALFRCRDELRRQKRVKVVGVYNPNASVFTDHKITPEFRAMVHDLIKDCSDEELQLIEWKISEGLSDEEIAENLKCGRAWVQRCWGNLRNKLKDKYNAVA